MKQKQILLSGNRQKYLIAINDIVLVKADNVSSYVFLENGTSFSVSQTITYIEQQINNQNFYRTHRSYLLNVTFIETYRKSEKKVSIKKHSIIVPVARDKNKDFETTLNNLFLVKR